MTLPVGLLTFQGEHSTDWAIVMAGDAEYLVHIGAVGAVADEEDLT